MEYNQTQPVNTQPYQYIPSRPANRLAAAAMVLGIISVLTAVMGTVYFPFLFGSIGIVLAVLSKGYESTMHTKALIGMITCIVALILNITILFSSIYMVFTIPEYGEQFNKMYEQFYGESFDDTIKNMTGEESHIFE